MRKAGGLIRLIRPINCILVGFAVLVGAIIGDHMFFQNSIIRLFFAFITGSTLTGSAMAINDYFDREIDSINEPDRPIPSGTVMPNEAIYTSIILSSIGLAASFMTGIASLGIATFSWFVMMLYSKYGKKTGFFGNILVSICIAIPFIYGGVLNGRIELGSSSLFALIAFLAGLGREITKGIVDIEGDRVMGIRTIAASRGEVTASRVSAIFYLAALSISFIPVHFDLVSLWYVPFVAFTDLGLLYLSISLIKNPSRENSRRVKNLIMVLMIFGLIGFLAGSLF